MSLVGTAYPTTGNRGHTASEMPAPHLNVCIAKCVLMIHRCPSHGEIFVQGMDLDDRPYAFT